MKHIAHPKIKASMMSENARQSHLRLKRESLQRWKTDIVSIFPKAIPEKCVWIDLDEIIEIINVIGVYEQGCHMFLPKSGGVEMGLARRADEKGCIELESKGKGISIVKPKRLIFQSFMSDSLEWAYFRLESQKMNPINKGISHHDFYGEELALLTTGDYDDVSKFDYYDEEYEPQYKGCRRVSRYTEGSFVIFAKMSSYNLETATYDGRHNDMTAEEFKNYINMNIALHKKLEEDESFKQLINTAKAG